MMDYDGVFGDEECDGIKSFCNGWGNDLVQEDLSNIIIDVVGEVGLDDIVSINGSNIYIDDVIYDGMGSRDWKINFGVDC